MPKTDRNGKSTREKRLMNIEDEIERCEEKMRNSKPGKPLYEHKQQKKERLIEKLRDLKPERAEKYEE